jgi:hypothetical protein
VDRAETDQLESDALGHDAGDAGIAAARVITGEVTPSGATHTVQMPGLPLDHAFVICSFRSSRPEPFVAPTCQLDKSGVVITTGDAQAVTTVRYHVVQHPAARVRRGPLQLGTNNRNGDAPLVPPVNLGQTFALVTSRIALASTDADEQRLVLARLEPNRLWISRDRDGTPLDIEWQVVELEGATVQSDYTILDAGNSSVTVQINAVDLNRSFLLFSSRPKLSTQGKEAVYSARGWFKDARNIEFDRGAADTDLFLFWFVVELPSGDRVHNDYDSALMSSNRNSAEHDLPFGVPPDRSFPLHSCNLANWAQASALNAASVTTQLVPETGASAARIRFQREDPSGDMGCAWSVVELAAP